MAAVRCFRSLADQERFDRTEKRIQKALRRLNAVKPMNLDGTPKRQRGKGDALFET